MERVDSVEPGLQVGEEGDAYHAFPFFSAAGGYYFAGPDSDGNYDTSDLGLTSEGGLAWADAFSKWGKDGVVKSTFVGDDLTNAWSQGKLAYWITGPWNKETVEDAEKKNNVKFSAESLPTWDGLDSPSVPSRPAVIFRPVTGSSRHHQSPASVSL